MNRSKGKSQKKTKAEKAIRSNTVRATALGYSMFQDGPYRVVIFKGYIQITTVSHSQLFEWLSDQKDIVEGYA